MALAPFPLHTTLFSSLSSATLLSSLPLYSTLPLPPPPPSAMKISEDDPITLPTHLITSLLDEISNVQSFRGKWSIVATKISHLRSHLSDFSHYPCSTSNSLFLDLLQSISNTLHHALSLATKCQTSCLTDGKLKTQSDIDFVIATLDRQIGDADILIKSGVFLDGAVSSSTSRREAVRAESRNLITRLQIGTPESKNSSMDSLLGLLREDDKNVMIAVAQGVVQILVRLLDSTSLDLKEKAVAAISRISVVDSSKHVLVAEGLVLLNHLLRVLDSGGGFAKEKACIALQSLSYTKENARAIGSRGGISSLLEICQAGTPGSQASAARVLRNLTAFNEIKENVVEENGIIVLLGLLGSGTALAQENAIGCLCNLAADDDNLKILIVKEGGIACLRSIWGSSPSIRSLEATVELLRHLALYPATAEVLIANGFIGCLVEVLNSGILGVRIAATRAVYELGFCTKTRKDIGETGCITPLIKMLDGKASEEKEAAAKALSNLMSYAANRRIFQKDERGIVSAVQLLDPSVHNLDKKYPVSLLASLVESKSCRKQMVAAGACLYLQKLVELEVEGSKKLLENLGRGKIWGVFARP